MRRMEAVKPPVSYADLQRMPDDGNRYELYDGELWMVPAPRRLMERYRVPEYWIVDPETSFIEISQLSGSEYGAPLITSSGRCASRVIPGFEVDLEEPFAGL